MKRDDINAELIEELKQPSKDFTGRVKELAELDRRVKPGQTDHVWYMYGYGGVGKSDLLKTFRKRLREQSLPCAYVDLGSIQSRSDIEMLHELAIELGITELGGFNKAFDRYDRLLKAQPTAADAVREVGGAVGAAADAVRKVVSAGGAPPSMAHLPKGSLLDKAKERLAGKMNDNDLRFLTNASDELFRAFTAGLCDYVQTEGRQLPVVLLFDTFERAWAGQLDALDALIHACLRAELQVLFVIAGRDDPDSLRPDDKRWWQKGEVMDPYPLGNLVEAKEFLGKKGVTEPELVRRILKLTGGFPMFLRMACEVVELTSGTQAEIAKDFPEGRMDEEKVTQYLLGRILDRLPEGKNDLKAAVRLLRPRAVVRQADPRAPHGEHGIGGRRRLGPPHAHVARPAVGAARMLGVLRSDQGLDPE